MAKPVGSYPRDVHKAVVTLATQGAALDRAGYKPLSQDRWVVPSFYAHQFAMAIMALEA